jgi:hypothetical protein
MSHKFTTTDLGLAAYLEMPWPKKEGEAKVIGREDRTWFFESDRPLTEWQIEYMQDKARCHDSQLMVMRNMINDERGR